MTGRSYGLVGTAVRVAVIVVGLNLLAAMLKPLVTVVAVTAATTVTTALLLRGLIAHRRGW